ncbi:alpha/beta fold hydrolase [Litorimonas haliclonae]|uniref:alpha/beta fold hydrolase n=1 Tax=Litorimonas haliclonae TaxID=2081977 RepID=UPI0039F0DDD3
MTKTYQDIFYKSSDGLTLYARDYDDGTGKPVILGLHGLTRNSADFHDLALHLQDRFRVVTVDQRGRGRSGYDPDASQYRLEIYCADMFTLLDHLGIKKVIPIGTSMGGLMTMIMASQNPDVFRAAVINDIGPEIAPEGLERIKGYVGASRDFASWEEAADAIKTQQSTEVFPLYTSQDWMDFARRVCRQSPDGRIEFAYDPALANPFKEDESVSAPVDMWPLFANLSSVPVLTFRGARSDILSDKTLEKMSRSHPDFRGVIIPNIGHAPILTEPESLAEIDAFLEPFK